VDEKWHVSIFTPRAMPPSRKVVRGFFPLCQMGLVTGDCARDIAGGLVTEANCFVWSDVRSLLFVGRLCREGMIRSL